MSKAIIIALVIAAAAAYFFLMEDESKNGIGVGGMTLEERKVIWNLPPRPATTPEINRRRESSIGLSSTFTREPS